MKEQDAHAYADAFKSNHQPPWLYALYCHWRLLWKEPFRGVTSDGTVRSGLFELRDEGVPIEDIVGKTEALWSQLGDLQREKLQFHIDSPEWRTWSNPEFLLSHKGLRLDEITPETRVAILAVLQATVSQEGYEKATKAMRINGYLGKLVESPMIMNEYSYNFALFGTPSITRPWGFSFYGHHLCLNVFLYQRQIVISPWFTGAEPNEIETGEHAGTRILHVEESLGLELMQSLSKDLQDKARIYEHMLDPKMPPGRWNKDDQRHMCGAYRDNRVIPYEGVLVSSFNHDLQRLVEQIAEQYLLYLPTEARRVRLQEIRSWYGETYFSWIGGFGDKDPFYYRVQSPVVVMEFDHHSGVFLTNQEPAKFHIHTLLRTPNGGDYGFALRPQIPPVEGYPGTEIKW